MISVKLRMICSLTMGLAAAVATHPAMAQSWPTKPVKMMVASGPGGSPDVAARLISDLLSKSLGKQFTVENKVGAGGIIAVTALKDSPKDGYTFALIPAAPIVLTPLLFKNVAFSVERDLQPVSMVGMSPIIAAVKADSPIKTLADLIAASKAAPSKTTVATTQINSVPNLIGVLINKRANAAFNIVPFPTSPPGLTAVLNGEAAAMIDGIPTFDGMVKGGQMRPIAVFSKEKLANKPEIPVAGDAVPGLVAVGWFGIFAPKGTPAEIVDQMNKAVADALANPEVVAKLAGLGVYPTKMSVAEFGRFIKDEERLWIDVVKVTEAKPQ